ncbi:MAG: response regulator transcription factor [Syntrophales bacterium]|nr:response regulator transcription factor [Syntrophales bacterium]
MGSLKIAMSHPLLSLSLKNFLEPYYDGELKTSTDKNIDNEQDALDASELIITDFSSLNNHSSKAKLMQKKIVLIDTGLSIHQKRVAVTYYNVRGIISNSSTTETFLDVLTKVQDGDICLDNETTNELVTHYRNRSRSKQVRLLTKREQEIIASVCKGFSNKEIATEMGISIPTVKALLSKVFRKLNVGSRSELCVNAIDTGLLNDLEF